MSPNGFILTIARKKVGLYPAGNYMFKVNNKNFRTGYIFIHILHFVLVFLLFL